MALQQAPLIVADDKVGCPGILELGAKGTKLPVVIVEAPMRGALFHFDHQQIVVISSATMNNDVREDGHSFVTVVRDVALSEVKPLYIEAVSIVFTVDVEAGYLFGQLNGDLMRHASFTRIRRQKMLVALDEGIKGSVQGAGYFILVHAFALP